MSRQNDTQSQDLALWRKFRGAGSGPTDAADGAPDDMTLAGYLDGTLDETARVRVEAWLAAAPERLDLLIATRKALAEPAFKAPESAVRRAMGLRPEPHAGTFGALFERVRAAVSTAGSSRPLGWSGIAAVLLLACVTGFELGRAGYETTLAADRHLAYDSGFGLGEMTEEFL